MKDLFELTQELEVLKYIFPKIIVATICGSIIGWERERKNKVAGLRTNVLICVGSAIFTIVSFLCSKYYNISDPTRILSTIVTGIGFLGGGVIMKHDDKIIGILCGMGFIISPILLTIGLLTVSLYFEKLERYIKKDIEKK